MAKIDKLKEEISTYRSKMLYALGFIMMFMAGYWNAIYKNSRKRQ